MRLFFGPVVSGALKAALRVGLDNWSRTDEFDIGYHAVSVVSQNSRFVLPSVKPRRKYRLSPS
jgi:hypothetical protein